MSELPHVRRQKELAKVETRRYKTRQGIVGGRADVKRTDPDRDRRLLGPQDCPFRPGKIEGLMIDFEYQCAVCAEISSDLSLNDCSKTGHGKQTDGQINR